LGHVHGALSAPHRGQLGLWADFLDQGEGWIDPAVERVYAVLDNLSAHRAADALLFALAHPRWEFVFQPTCPASLNLIEPWWKMLRSLALKGRRFETWAEVCQAIAASTAYWNSPDIPSFRAGAAAIGRIASPASPCRQLSPRLAG
jgi:hypothetical protein